MVRRIAGAAGLILALILAGCSASEPERASENPGAAWQRISGAPVACPVGDDSCRAAGAVRWAVPVDVPLAIEATEEHDRLEFLVVFDGVTPPAGYVEMGRASVADFAFVGAADTVYLRANGQVIEVSADTGAVGYAGAAAEHEPPVPSQTGSDDSGRQPSAGEVGLDRVVDALIAAQGRPIIDGAPVEAMLGCAQAVVDDARPISHGAPGYVGYCATPVLFAVNR